MKEQSKGRLKQGETRNINMPGFKSAKSTCARSQETKSEQRQVDLLTVSAYKFLHHSFLLVLFGSLLLFGFCHLSKILLEPSTNKTTKVKSIVVGKVFKMI